MHGPVIVVHRNYSRLFRERDFDLTTVCVQCLAEFGLLVKGEGADGHIEWWDADRYPYDPAAKIGTSHYRPGPDWPPSMDEIEAAPG